jgi:hypothetical protein
MMTILNSASSALASAPVIKGGELQVNVMTLNDLPSLQSPSHVLLQACGEKCKTGPPLSQDKNCFQFTNTTNPTKATNDTLAIKTKTLEYLHQTSVVVTVVYDADSKRNLKATFPMKELLVNQTTHLTLPLEPKDSPASGQPSIQLTVQLRGSLRSDIRMLVKFSLYWFACMDALERMVSKHVPPNVATMLVVPAILAALLMAPLVAGTMVLLLPFFFPLVTMFLTTAACLALAFGGVLASTSQGRHYLTPLVDRILQSTPGQALVYPLGSRLCFVSLAQSILPTSMYGRLALSLMIDAIGSSSYVLPYLGEASDVVWAPLQTLLIMAMYDVTTPKLKYLSFAEELLPFTDAIPSATIGWAAQFGPQLLGRKTVPLPDDLQLKEE